MNLYHPVFFIITVPEGKEEIREELVVCRLLAKEQYSSFLTAYIDCLEEALDCCRRIGDV